MQLLAQTREWQSMHEYRLWVKPLWLLHCDLISTLTTKPLFGRSLSRSTRRSQVVRSYLSLKAPPASYLHINPSAAW